MAFPYTTTNQVEEMIKDYVGEHGGTTVIANPTLVGSESKLGGLQVDNTKYKVTKVVANPTLSGSEGSLTGVEVDGVKYKITSSGTTGTQLYRHSLTLTDGSGTKTIILVNKKSEAYTAVGSVEQDWTSCSTLIADYAMTNGSQITRCPIVSIAIGSGAGKYNFSYIYNSNIPTFEVDNATISDEVFAL